MLHLPLVLEFHTAFKVCQAVIHQQPIRSLVKTPLFRNGVLKIIQDRTRCSRGRIRIGFVCRDRVLH